MDATLTAFSIFALLIVITSTEEECLKSRIRCYECESRTDSRCNDPFNASISTDLVPFKPCEGCCVKIVKNRDTPYQAIHRTCTANLYINLFMVDHVCMEESDGHGHMCFCESDACNKANNIQYFHSSVIILFITLFITISRLLRCFCLL